MAGATLAGSDDGSTSLWISEWSGAATTSVLDTNCWVGDTNCTAGTDKLVCGPMTTGFTNDMVLAFAAYSASTGTAGTNFTAISPEAGGFGEYFCKTNTGSIFPTVSSTSDETYGMISVAFKHR